MDTDLSSVTHFVLNEIMNDNDKEIRVVMYSRIYKPGNTYILKRQTKAFKRQDILAGNVMASNY